jgi:hypothetical protein
LRAAARGRDAGGSRVIRVPCSAVQATAQRLDPGLAMLSKSPVSATIPFRGLKSARTFYSGKLGLELSSGSVKEGYLAYRAGKGTSLLLFESKSKKKSDNTAATFEVANLAREMTRLRKKGVVFEEYDLPGI